MNALVNVLSNLTTTENGDLAYSSSGVSNLDWFAMGSALRNRNDTEVLDLFKKAYNEDVLLALLNIFHTRNIRGGQGERKTFRTVLKYLAKENSELVMKLLLIVPEYGRWDDLLVLIDTPVWNTVSEMMKQQILKDFALYKQNENISLLAKWLPSINTSSKNQVKIAKQIAIEWFGNNQPYKQYRKLLAVLRKHINIIETKLCNKQYDFDYSKLPSKASLQYVKAFKRNDEQRYLEYILSVEEGKAKVNTSTLYPYEILRKVYSGEENLDYLWNNLPNYCGNDASNVMVVADVSGSMDGTPLDMSVSLALYFAERIKGDFNHTFITFSDNPAFVTINKDDTLSQKFNKISQSDWRMSTNLRNVFELILNRAVANNVPTEDMPSTVLIISDMEFNEGVRMDSTFDDINYSYQRAGYERPVLVFWNVNSRNNTLPCMNNDKVVLCSGSSPVTLKYILSGNYTNPEEFMKQVILNSGLYQKVIDCFK